MNYSRLYETYKEAAPELWREFKSYIFAGFCGVVITALLFHFTKQPVSSSEINIKLKEMLDEKISHKNGTRPDSIDFNSVISQSLDLNPSASIFVYGTIKKDSKITRILAIFEPDELNILDKIVGRSPFFSITSLTQISVEDQDSLIPFDIKTEDYDLDGNKEIVVNVKSKWADSSSSGIILLKKTLENEWHFLSIPPLKDKLKQIINAEEPSSDDVQPIMEPTIWFAPENGSKKFNIYKNIDLYRNFDIYEDTWMAIHNGVKKNFITLRNRGVIKEFRHPHRSYPEFGIIATINDDEAVLSEHRIFVTFLKLGETELETDKLWNWGYPMLSLIPEEITNINLDDFHKIGIDSHIIDGIFFGYTDFERVNARPKKSGTKLKSFQCYKN